MGETRRLRGAVIGLGNVAVHGHLPGWRQVYSDESATIFVRAR